MILDRLAFLISRSWQALNAVLSVFFDGSGAFSCQKRSPFLRRMNWSAITAEKVGPRRPLPDGGSANPVRKKKKICTVKIKKITLLTRRIVLAEGQPSTNKRHLPVKKLQNLRII